MTNKTEENQLDTDVIYAISLYKASCTYAYEQYTTEIIKIAKIHGWLNKSNNDYEKFDKAIKSAKARLSQKKGVASKKGKSHLISRSLNKIANSKDFNVSNREVIEIIKFAAGRAISKTELRGLFIRKSEFGETRSPYFSNNLMGEKYREKMHSHYLVLELKNKINEYVINKPIITNHLQKTLENTVEKYKIN